MPVALPGIAFDAVNNLRSALDQAIYGINLAVGVTDRNSFFPIAKDGTHFQNAVKGRCKNLPPEIVNLISSFKPYKGGNDLLWALNELCNTDKHGIISPVALNTSSVHYKSMVFHTGFRGLGFPIWDRTKNEMELYRLAKGGTAETDFNITHYIAICNVEFVDGQPSEAVLGEFVRIVEGIVLALEAETARLGLG